MLGKAIYPLNVWDDFGVFRGVFGGTHIDFHVPEPADIPEAPALLPQGADGLTAQGGLTVPEGAGIALGAGGVEVEVAVIALAGHAARILTHYSGFAPPRALPPPAWAGLASQRLLLA